MSPAQPCNFSYPIDFVVKHPVAPEINPVPTLGWVEQLGTLAGLSLLKGQHPFGMFSFEQFEFTETESGTAGPSASLGMTNYLRISQEICGRRDL
jgi:hypothetical protein